MTGSPASWCRMWTASFGLPGDPIHPARWARLLDSGAVRPCRGAGLGLHIFAEPMLLHYVLLRAELDEAGLRQQAGEIA